MKKIISIIALILIVFTSNATTNNEGYSNFYNAYKGSEDIVSFRLPTTLLSFFLYEEEDKEIRQFLNKSKNLKFFISDESKKLLPILNKYISTNEYQDALVIKNSEDNITFKVHDNGTAISEVIMIIEEENSFVVMSFEGNFTHKDLQKFMNSVDTEKVLNSK